MQKIKIPATCWLSVFLISGYCYAQSTVGNPRVMQGPMIGATSTTSCTIWLRISGNFDAQIEYSEYNTMRNASLTKVQKATKEKDYILLFHIDSLKPDTEYYYRVRVNDDWDSYLRRIQPFRFKRLLPTGIAKISNWPTGHAPGFSPIGCNPSGTPSKKKIPTFLYGSGTISMVMRWILIYCLKNTCGNVK